MDLFIVILLIGLSIWGSYSKQKKQREQQEAQRKAAQARAAQAASQGEMPQAPDPRFPQGTGPFAPPVFPFPGPVLPQKPADPPVQTAPAAAQTPLPDALSDDTEGEPEEPANPMLWQKRQQAEQRRRLWEQGKDGGEGADEPEGGVQEATMTVREHLRVTAGRNEEIGNDSHTERSMEGPRPAVISLQETAPTPAPAAIASLRVRFDKNAVIGGVVMSEVLGKPKALRRR